ncbi:MAG TPA: aromatic-ring-hydroxylating dioxygenase subunit beta [Burkholderiales bacterium]|nr:aromatic-ring-hydroxylating dioxygenase subunit beta [Burkholderiales bacterium]
MSARPTIADIVRFVKHEARLIDEKRFDEWYELFTEDAHYWVPAVHGQTDPLLQNSLAYEDKLLLKLRIERLKSPLAYSQRPASRCLHVLQEPDIERSDHERGEYLTRTPFIYTETRVDDSQRYAATAWHTLVWSDDGLRILLKRVDILNCDAMLPSIQLFL